jgi:hypothetical protein
MRTVLAMLVAAVVVALALSGRDTPATAQPGKAPAPEVGRYQLSAFSYSSQRGQTNGAYILDTATGEVFVVHEQAKPASLGSVPKDKK